MNRLYLAGSQLARLGSGLRINGLKPEAGTALAGTGAAGTGAARPPRETADAGQIARQNRVVREQFAETLSRRLQNDQETPKTAEEVQALVGAVASAVEEIKKQCGDQAANQVMAGILNNTERRLGADNIAAAASDVLKGLLNLNKSVLAKPEVSKDEYARAQDQEKKLKDLLEFLNRGTGEGGGDPKGPGRGPERILRGARTGGVRPEAFRR